MAYEQRDNSGSLFKNNKPRNDKSPQWSGKAMIDGKMRFFDAWEKTDKNGNRWFSCSFKQMEQVKTQIEREQEQSQIRAHDDFEDSEIPF